ncbi:hypothetical protein BU15DRAFT_69436, partial [Melanogaster broomeanus]
MILHITSSSIVQFQTYNGTAIQITSSTLSWPNSTDYGVSWETVSSLVPYVSQFAGISMVGLVNDTLYEVIGPNHGVGNVNVRAVTVQADCGLVSNANISFGSQAAESGDVNPLSSTGQWTITSAPPTKDQILMLPNPIPGIDLISGGVLFLASTGMAMDNSVIRQAAIPITVQYNNSSMIMYAFVIACGASLIPREAVVDAQTGELKELVPLSPTGAVSTSWEILDWNTSDNFGFNDSYFNAIQGECVWNSTPTFQLDVENMQNTVAKQVSFSVFTVQVIESFAAGLFGGAIGFQRPPSQINVLPLSFATAASVIILVLAVHMTHMDNRAHPLVSNTGVLDVLWLSSRLPELTERLATVKKPSTDSLRAVGKFNVCLAEPTPSTESQDGDLENAMKVDN